jgi:hypothetical protein
MVMGLTMGLVVEAAFGLSAGVCTKVLGVALIFTGTMSLKAIELCKIIQFLTRKYLPISVEWAMYST